MSADSGAVDPNWPRARLIPVSGIGTAVESERRATSALLAVLTAVEEFSRAMLKPLGAPAGTVQAFVETPFDLNGKNVIPDGLIRVSRGKTHWTALVEVKTGSNDLRADQLEQYLDVAKAHGFDAVVTISNQIVAVPGVHPTAAEIDKRKLRGKVALNHLAWSEVLATAVTVRRHTGVADVDQAWILQELIRYLEYPKSGALGFETMGSEWVPVREAVRAGTIRPNDKGAPVIAGRFDALLRFIGLRLGQRLGRNVTLHLTRAETADPTVRLTDATRSLVEDGVLSGDLKVPDTVGNLRVRADLRANLTECSVDVAAPGEGRNRTRVNWLVRQLKDAPGDLRIEASFERTRTGTALLLDEVRANPDELLDGMAERELKAFRVAQVSKMGTNRDTGKGSFITTLGQAVDQFYSQVIQGLRPWTAPAPRLPKHERPDPDTVKPSDTQTRDPEASTDLVPRIETDF